MPIVATTEEINAKSNATGNGASWCRREIEREQALRMLDNIQDRDLAAILEWLVRRAT